ncbi:MAG: DUF1826 domain-containing protein [Rhodospirillales bacterium]|nr:DUF1826 domain-containing protein [Rhodospirillales bacterium]
MLLHNRIELSSTTTDDAGAFVPADSPDVLNDIVDDTIDLALWHRPVPPELDAWIRALPAGQLPVTHEVVAPNEVAARVRAACREAGHDGDDPVRMLAQDIAGLAGRFCRVAGLAEVDLRLAAIHHDACKRFHRDRMPLRLIATYRGPGTELVPQDHAADALNRQADYDGPLHVVEHGTVALFRGSAAGDVGVVHRSPPITGMGISRLLLCLSTPFQSIFTGSD